MFFNPQSIEKTTDMKNAPRSVSTRLNVPAVGSLLASLLMLSACQIPQQNLTDINEMLEHCGQNAVMDRTPECDPGGKQE